MTANRRYQVAAEELRLEMFVVELDRPWLDTPFLLQGFMIDSKVELDTLVKYCDYVYVDLALSSPMVADVIRRVEIQPPALEPQTQPLRAISQAVASAMPARLDGRNNHGSAVEQRKPAGASARKAVSAGAASGVDAIVARAAAPSEDARRRYRPRADVKISQQTRQRFRNFVRQTADAGNTDEPSLVERWLGPLLNLFGHEQVIDRRKASSAIPLDLLPEGIKRIQHEQRSSMLEELPRARQAFSQGEATLAEVMVDIRSGKAPQLEAIEGAVDGMVESMLDNPDALMWIARLREEDITTYNHGVKVALYLVALGRHLGFPKQELAYLGQIGMLGDIGKTKLPRAILEKPGMLSPAEFELVKEHVALALQVLTDGPKLPAAVTTGIAQHHERIDGSGYPKGLKGNQISIHGKMAAIADSFSALITPRPYANASAPQDALMNLYEWSGTSFHEPMVEQFVQAIGVFPVGSMIELTTGEIGVVVAHNRVRRLEPKVLILSNPDKTSLAQPLERDLFKEGKSKGSKPLRITRGLPAGAYGFKLRDYYLDEIAKQNGIVA
jgi:HD-GYP domain-containing protein (c-di-GMP phosphodiesterase class II)